MHLHGFESSPVRLLFTIRSIIHKCLFEIPMANSHLTYLCLHTNTFTPSAPHIVLSPARVYSRRNSLILCLIRIPTRTVMIYEKISTTSRKWTTFLYLPRFWQFFCRRFKDCFYFLKWKLVGNVPGLKYKCERECKQNYKSRCNLRVVYFEPTSPSLCEIQ